MKVGVPFLLRGSAICTWRETVCMDIACSDVAERNLCRMNQLQGYSDLAMTLLLLVLVAVVSLVQNNVSAALDESIQTAQDYSVRLKK